MKHISILVLNGAILASLEGSRRMFDQVNSFLAARGREPCFQVQLVGLAKETPLQGGLFTVNADLLLEMVHKTDLIVIPSLEGEIRSALEQNRAFIPWIIRQYQCGAEVASLCVGAFLLAATGLLRGRQCATHWMAANDFKKMFPDVRLVTDKIIIDEQGMYSGGGAFSFLNLILYLIEKFAGRDLAILSAKVFAIEIDRSHQSPLIIFQGQKTHEDELIKKAQVFIEHNFYSRITVDQLASMLSLGRRNLERRFKKATANTVTEYIQRVKVEVTKKSLETSCKNINEVMYDVGYTDSKAFRSIFRKITGLSPLEYRNKYNKEAACS